MRRFKNLVIGGIQSKVFNLILITVLLLMAAVMAMSLYQNKVLTNLAAESGNDQQQAISDIAGKAMDQVVAQSLTRANTMEAGMVNGVFSAAAQRVAFVADCAARLFAHPENYAAHPYAPPDPSDDGQWTAKVIYAPTADRNDSALDAKLGLLANLSETMISLCPSVGASVMYIGLPEGVHLTVNNFSSSWLEDGKVRAYDPRQRGWYQQAAREGRLIFTDGEWDANTDAYCVECAMPVYDPSGRLQAVVGTDLYLKDIEAGMKDNLVEGEHALLINQEGRAILPMQAKVFPIASADRNKSLLDSQNGFLAQFVRDALQGVSKGVSLGQLEGGNYYIVASPIETTGWVLLSAYNQAMSDQPTIRLKDSLSTIQGEAAATYKDTMVKANRSSIVLFALIMVLALGAALVQSTRIVKPLNTIVQRISELREGNLEFKMEDVYRTGDEVEELAQSFAALSHKTVEYVDTVKRVTAEKERIGTELSLANQIQASMLPHIFPAFPDRPDFDVYATMDPAKEVGGDFYDYFLIDDDHLCMVIADVSGKGVPAALFMMASKIILQSVAMLGKSPAEILSKTNEAICSNNEAQMFVTVWLGILELSTGKLTCANAGHEYPVLKMPGGDFAIFKDRHGFVIGGMEGARYREYEIQLEPGSKLFVYTDGVPEATNGDKELFGTERMVKALNGALDDAPLDVLKTVRRAVDGFVKDAEQFDDLTMLCLEYKGSGPKEGTQA